MESCRMLSVLCMLMIFCSVLTVPVRDPALDTEFEEWKTKHEKVYSGPEEEATRRQIWEKTRKEVEEHNKEADQGLHSYWMGMNQFSDRTTEENSRGCLLPLPMDLDEFKQNLTVAGNSSDGDNSGTVTALEAGV